MRTAPMMTEFAWRFRYPGEPKTVSHHDAIEAIETAERVFESILGALPATCRQA
jgi:HEPN domain-containing protein